MKHLWTLSLLLLLAGCGSIRPHYYNVDSTIQIQPVDEVFVDGKKIESYEPGSNEVDIGTSLFDRIVTLKKEGKTVEKFQIDSRYIDDRGAVYCEGKGKPFVISGKTYCSNVSPAWLLLPMNTILGAIPAVVTLAIGIIPQPFLLINDLGILWDDKDLSLHAKVFEPFLDVMDQYNGLIVQDVVNIANFPGVVYHNKWRQNGPKTSLKKD